MIKLGKLVLSFVLAMSLIQVSPVHANAQTSFETAYADTTKVRSIDSLNYTPRAGEDLTTFHEAPLYDVESNQLLLPRVEGYTTSIRGSDRRATIALDGQVERGLETQEVALLYTLTNKESGEEIFTTTEAHITIPGKELTFHGSNAMPNVLPQLREWAGGDGNVVISEASRIVYHGDLAKTAETFQSDLQDITGMRLEIVAGTKEDLRDGDIYLLLDDAAIMMEEEGYYLEIGGSNADQNYTVVRAHGTTGVYYGTISILQILKQDAGRSHLPKGVARDYPQFEERGMMLDVARKYFTIEYLENLTKQMSWYKMNFLSLHLSDNDIWDSLSLADGDASPEGWFRLESDTFPELTSKDHYTKEEFRNLQYLGMDLGVEIVPELDTPGHALSYTRAWEGLQRPDNPKYLDVLNPQVLENVKALFDEYILGVNGEEPTFVGDKVNIGTDEYKTAGVSNAQAYREGFRAYTDALLKHVNSLGKEAVFWGSLTENAGTTPVTNEAIMFAWYRGYANPNQAINEGYKIISMEDLETYIVPGGGYYANEFGQGERLYNSWLPNSNTGWPSGSVSMAHPNVLGGQFAVWNDFSGNGISMQDVSYRMQENMFAIADKTWANTERKENNTAWSELNAFGKALGDAPNADFLYDIENDIEIVDNQVLTLNEGLRNEVRENTGATILENKNISIINEGKVNKGLSFAGGESYLKTDIKSAGFDWTASFWIKPDQDLPQETVLMEGDTGTLLLVDHKLAYRVEQYTHTFDQAIDPEEWTLVTLTSDYSGVTLYLDGKFVDTLAGKPYPSYNCASGANLGGGTHPSNGTCATARYYETLTLPMEYIGSKTNAFKGSIDELTILDRALSAQEIAAMTGEKVYKNIALNKTVTSSGNETANWTAEKVVDGDLTSKDSRWSSNYDDAAWLTIDLGKGYNVDHIKVYWEAAFAKQYKMLVSETGADGDWVEVYNETNGAEGLADIKFDMKSNIRYVKFQGVERTVVAGGKWGYSMYEIEVYGDMLENDPDIDPDKDYQNVALHKEASSTHHHFGDGIDRVANYAVDGDLTTRFEFDENQTGVNDFSLTLGEDEDVNHMIIKEKVWSAEKTRLSAIRITEEKNGIEKDLVAQQTYASDAVAGGIATKEFTFAASSKGATIHVYMTPIAAGPDNLVNIAEIEMYGSKEQQGDGGLVDGAVIPHSQMSAFASSQNALVSTEGPAYLAIDDNVNSWWHTNYTPKEDLPQSLTLDLSEIMSIGSYRYLPRPGAGNGTITKYELQVSLDNEHYITIAAGEWALTAAEKTLNFDPVRARYVRLLVLEGKQGFGSAAEVNVHYAEMKNADHTYLNIALEEAQVLLDGDAIMTSSKEALQSAVTKAASINDDPAASQETIDKAVSDLNEALEAVEYRGDKDVLQSAYDEVLVFFAELHQDDYTVASYQALSDQLSAVASLLKDSEELAQTAMEDAKMALLQAKANLVDRSVLRSAIEAAEALPLDFYQKDGADAMRIALADAKAAYESGKSKFDITKALYQLQDAQEALVIDYHVLQEAIAEYDGKEEMYTVSSWDAFKDVLAAAKAAVEDKVSAEFAEEVYEELITQAKALKLRGDTTALNALIQIFEHEDLVESDYTSESWNVYEEALQAAKDLIANKEDAGVDDVKAKTEALQEAYRNLQKASIDKSALKAALDSYVETTYTTSSWALFKDTYQEAQALYDNDQATLAQITKMVETLQAKASVLVTRGDVRTLAAVLSSKEFQELNALDYTEETWVVFAEARSQAEAMINDNSDVDSTDVMTMVTRLMTAKAGLEKRPVVTVDKTALQEKVDSFHEEDYTISSWTAFEVYEEALAALASDAVTQQEVDALVVALDEAAKDLVYRGDSTALQALVNEVAALNKDTYTNDSWKVVAAAQLTAQDALDHRADLSQAQCDELTAVLRSAKDQLIRRGNVDALKALLNKVAQLVETEYTTESWTALMDAKQDAKEALINSANLSQTQVDEKTAALQKAVDNLEKASTPDPVPGPVDIMDKDGHVQIEALPGVLPEDTTLSVSVFNEKNTSHALYSKVAGALGNNQRFTAFDLHLYSGELDVHPDGKVIIRLHVPADYDVNQMKLYEIDELAGRHELSFKILDNDMIEFVTDQIHIYTLVDTREPSDQGSNVNPDGNKDNTPTGDQTNVIFWVSLLVLAGGCLSFVLYRRKKNQK